MINLTIDLDKIKIMLTTITDYLFHSNEYLGSSLNKLNEYHKSMSFNFSIISIVSIFGKIISYFIDVIILISLIKENR